MQNWESNTGFSSLLSRVSNRSGREFVKDHYKNDMLLKTEGWATQLSLAAWLLFIGTLNCKEPWKCMFHPLYSIFAIPIMMPKVMGCYFSFIMVKYIPALLKFFLCICVFLHYMSCLKTKCCATFAMNLFCVCVSTP